MFAQFGSDQKKKRRKLFKMKKSNNPPQKNPSLTALLPAVERAAALSELCELQDL